MTFYSELFIKAKHLKKYLLIFKKTLINLFSIDELLYVFLVSLFLYLFLISTYLSTL